MNVTGRWSSDFNEAVLFLKRILGSTKERYITSLKFVSYKHFQGFPLIGVEFCEFHMIYYEFCTLPYFSLTPAFKSKRLLLW